MKRYLTTVRPLAALPLLDESDTLSPLVPLGPRRRASLRGMEIEWDESAEMGYINLLPPEDRVEGVVHESVLLAGLEEASEIDALHSLVLDFDKHGKLIGIEILSRDAVPAAVLSVIRKKH